ncbi:unnamed protein product [Phytophthora fragariaefolia]|uniref:Unnamed protein product n=1 Tax=Phytophthora fragariaefolia TaxID=1490495 RepID=A0A9W7D8C6_9STRA|nr:unnamed protein product [Phytophthora fragariaefolia]
MLKAHRDHRYSVGARRSKIDEVSTRISTYNSATASERPKASEKPKAKKQKTIPESMTINEDEIRLIVPACETIYKFGDGEYALFIKWVSRTIAFELAAVQRRPFVSVLHDLFANSANVNIIGVTFVYISSNWRLVKLSVLGLPSRAGHAAATVANQITQAIQSRYDIDLHKISRFTVSDTTGSAKNVSNYFNDSDQVDCLIHLASLCLLCALGLKENTTVRQDGRVVVTPGGEFREGLAVIQKLRDLATFFAYPTRQGKLKEIKTFFSLPDINIAADAKTRVGFSVKLMRRSIFKFYAFTNLGEVQKETISSSFSLLFRKMTSLSAVATSIDCMVFDRPPPKGNESNQRREPKRVQYFSDFGKRCQARLRMQLALRFPDEDINEVKALLLNRRMKSKDHSIVKDRKLVVQAERELQIEHEVVYLNLFSSTMTQEDNIRTDVETTVESTSSSSNSSIDELLEIDAPTGVEKLEDIHADVHLRSSNPWNQWKNLHVKWPCEKNSVGKQNLLQLYFKVDIRAGFKDNESFYSAVAVLARIYLGKPISTATQKRFFSMSGYVVDEPRTSLDEDRGVMLCLMKANWSSISRSLMPPNS